MAQLASTVLKPDNYHQVGQAARTQQAHLTACTWEGAPVFKLRGEIAQLFLQIPLFSRHPFRIGNEENRFKDEIRREPLKITDDPIPVARCRRPTHSSSTGMCCRRFFVHSR